MEENLIVSILFCMPLESGSENGHESSSNIVMTNNVGLSLCNKKGLQYTAIHKHQGRMKDIFKNWGGGGILNRI